MRQFERPRIVTEGDADVFHPGVLQASRQLFDPEVHLRIGLLAGLARMPETETARDASVLDYMPPLKRLSGKLKVQMLVIQGVLQLSGMGPRRAWDVCSLLGSPLGREEQR